MVHKMEKNGIEVAIVGIAGKYPQADNVQDFFDNLKHGKECLTTFTDEELQASDPWYTQDANYVKRAGIINDATGFDNKFFNISNRDALLTDPQQRIFLQTAWHALEDAGCDPFTYQGDIALYGGSSSNTYLSHHIFNSDYRHEINQYPVVLGNEKDFLCTRVSHALNLRGPAMTIQTGCSTSLVAVHMACQSLLNGECDIAMAGGVTIRFPVKAGYKYQDGGILSPDGHCRPFDQDACGTVVSDGCGIVVLKLLEDALRDRDQIYCVIKGSSINNDGQDKMGFTSPSISGQARVIEDTLQLSCIDASQISYVETHGTGTKLGDPIEINALKEVYSGHQGQKVKLGSVKANIGHTDSASGISGLIKVALMMKHHTLLPQIHFNQPNPLLELDNSPLEVNTQLADWYDHDTDIRYAAVSSFGLGGTNAHMIVESGDIYLSPSSHTPSKPQHILLSGRTAHDLIRNSQQIAAAVQHDTDQDLADIAYTLATGRHHFPYRQWVQAENVDELHHQLAALTENTVYQPTGICRIKIYQTQDLTLSETFVNSANYFNFAELPEKHRFLAELCEQMVVEPLEVEVIYTNELIDKVMIYAYNADIKKVAETDCEISYLGNDDIFNILCWLWQQGLTIHWEKFYAVQPVRKVSLPGYAFNQTVFEIEPTNTSNALTTQPEAEQPTSDDSAITLESIQDKIRQLWLNDLGETIPSAETTDIYELCGDSFTALQMNIELEDFYEISLSNKTFIENNTLNKISEVIYHLKHGNEHSTFDEHIVCFNDQGDLAPVFLIHPAGGTVMGYKEVARSLPEGHPVYGIQYPFRDEGNDIVSMCDLARHYNEKITALYPTGNLILAGHSFGGNAALEMALQFEQAGRTIEQVIMFDSHPPQAYFSNTVFSEQQFLASFPVICGMFFNTKEPLNDMKSDTLEDVVDYLKQKGWVPWGFSTEEFKLYYELWRSNHNTLRTHMPSEKLKADLIFFKAAVFQPQEILDVLNISLVEGTEIAQWQCFAQSTIKEFVVPGTHYTMLDKENVDVIADILHELLTVTAAA
ncbi:Phosphopantetheine attachment site [Vibrio gazogenes DSM 21264]|uniref:Phosphopantetheine attachment site n=2 Tax=Vibrio gazogenes TaxID=687 RepID=A0A1M5HI57_VIBGA|nr:Phosphopantetheine attachment site [Vibrio gazogenes DSM 21264] [Vibrio gazogenes DSM 21264 = NBRC 103151]SJN56704.1 Phthiocerol/phenolphthiocerol synthesis polyketide synthase type I PpsE [Vibrio gazogenes]